jgi:predicted GNAT superfamily acetyltransferase
MTIEYLGFNGMPDAAMLRKIMKLHIRVFGSEDDLAGRMQEKPNLRIEAALDGETLVGYKIGYSLNREQFYSWLGGVDELRRNQGIAAELLIRQHDFARTSGYRTIQTRTKNKWRNMLLLNIKKGFDVIGTYTDSDGEPKIILEKKLFE